MPIGLAMWMIVHPPLHILVSWALIPFLGAPTKQRAVARSTTEAEYRALATAASETMWLSTLLKDLAFPVPASPHLLCDNLGATYLSFNPVNHSRMKHIHEAHSN